MSVKLLNAIKKSYPYNMQYKTQWDLTHIYKKDPENKIKKDCAFTKKMYKAFVDKYRKNKNHLKSPKALKTALEEYESLSSDKRGSSPIMYYHHCLALNSEDSVAEQGLAKLQDFYADISNQTEFFMLEIGKIEKNIQKKMLDSKELTDFRYMLTKVFENAKHTLSEAEEKILTLKSNPARGMWVAGFEKLLSSQTIKWRDRELPIGEASSIISKLKTKERRDLHGLLMKKLKEVGNFAESEINAIVTNKKIDDKLRGFKTPYEATVKGYENEEKTVKDLVDTVTKNFEISHSFFKLKAKMLGEKKLTYADRGAKIDEVVIPIPFKDAVSTVINSFNKADPEFGEFVKNMFEEGKVDVYPKRGKNTGAFCSSEINIPTYVLLNQTDDFRSMTTIAHEMGHALHSKYSKTQRPIYQDYTIATAEVASTFFENLVFEEASKNVGPREKMILLHDKIGGDIATIFRQIACFNFENELHESIRKEGFLQKEKIAELMNKHMSAYIGPICEFTQDDGYFFAHWSHIRNFFYVYSYAFGQLISDALYERYKKDNTKIKDIIEFLKAGGSDSPENIFRKIGINPNKKLFETGLQKIKKDIEELESLWDKYGNNK